jgi:chromosomal replication initiation ATPase DnaA
MTTFDKAAHCVSRAFDVDKSQLLGRSRPAWITEPRFALCELLVASGFTMKVVAGWLGRDTSAISHSCRRSRELRVCPEYRRKMGNAVEYLNA